MIPDLSQLHAMQNILTELQSMINEIQQIYLKIMSCKNPEEIRQLEGQLKLTMEKVELFKNQYGITEPTQASSEPPVP